MFRGQYEDSKRKASELKFWLEIDKRFVTYPNQLTEMVVRPIAPSTHPRMNALSFATLCVSNKQSKIKVFA